MSKLMLRRQCPSRIRYQLVPSLYRATSPRIPENFLLKAQTVPLPNDSALPTASILVESSEKIFLAEWYFVTKLGPQVSPFPIPIFGVNNLCPRPPSKVRSWAGLARAGPGPTENAQV
jgi:hypothetical protein